MARLELVEQLIQEVGMLIDQAISLQAETPSIASPDDLITIRNEYQDWYARSLAVLPENLILEFKKQYEGTKLSSGIRAFLANPIAKNVFFNESAAQSGTPQAFPYFQVPVQASFVRKIDEQRLILRQARERYVLSSPSEASMAVYDESQAPVVFLGHSQNPLFLRVAEHIRKLGLDVESFESGSRTAKQIIQILEQMLERPSAAVILLTGDDTTDSGRKRARQNVVHDLGLFHGRLGFERVAILVQQDVELFSNIDGLQHIQYRGDDIRMAFSELDEWLELINILKPRPKR